MVKCKMYVEVSEEFRRQYLKTIKKGEAVLSGAVDDFDEAVYSTKNEKAYKSWLFNLYQSKKFKIYDIAKRHPTLASLSKYIEWYNKVSNNAMDDVYVDISLIYSLYRFVEIKNEKSFVYPKELGKLISSKNIQSKLLDFKCERKNSIEMKELHEKLSDHNGITTYESEKFSSTLSKEIVDEYKTEKFNKIREVAMELNMSRDEFLLLLDYRKTLFNDVEIKNNSWFKFV